MRWASLSPLQETRAVLLSLLVRTEPLWARNLKRREERVMNTTEMPRIHPLQLWSSGSLGSPHLHPPEPPFPCTTLHVRHPVSSDHDAFLRPPSWSWLSQGRTLFFCHIEGMWRSHDSRVHSVKSPLMCFAVWFPHVSLRAFRAEAVSDHGEEMMAIPPASCPSRRDDSLCTLADTQVGLPEEWDTIPNLSQKHPVLSGKARSTLQTKSAEWRTHHPLARDTARTIMQLMFSLKRK